MAYTKAQFDRIFARTSGICHICHKKICRSNYGKLGARGAWEIEHSVPRCNGGSDYLNNLYAAHISCNRKKGVASSRTARRPHGQTRAPLSVEKRQRLKGENTLLGLVCGGVAGLIFGGPVGAVVGAVTCGTLGNSLNPDTTG